MSVRLSVRIGLPQKHLRTSRNFLYMLYPWPWLGVLLWRPCNTLCTSGFVDDVIFARNGLYVAWLSRIVEVIYQGAEQGAKSWCLQSENAKDRETVTETDVEMTMLHNGVLSLGRTASEVDCHFFHTSTQASLRPDFYKNMRFGS